MRFGESHVEFGVLGPFEVRHADEPVDIGGPRRRTVLARLVAAAGTVVSTDTLIDDLYSGAPPVNALASIHVQVSNLRRAIEPRRAPRTPPRLLVARRPGYMLATSNVDALRFARLVAESAQLPAAEALESLDEALSMWRGRPYGEFAEEVWAIAEVNRLQEVRLTAIERRAQALLDLGRPQSLIPELDAEIGDHPLRERLWWLLALALYRTGRQADALAALRRARRLLDTQLGLDPGPELRALEQDILRQAETLAPPSPESVAVPVPRRPPRVARTHLIGRERQLATLVSLPLQADRNGVVAAAVSGEPGIGKTRLLRAFRDECAQLGHLVLWGRCHEGGGVPPLWPWLQVLRELAVTVPPPGELAGLLDDRPPPEGTPRHRNMHIARWLMDAAGRRPLVIVLDDLHWADSATLELLRDVAVWSGGRAGHVSLTLVSAFRDVAADPFRLSVDEVLHQLARYDLVRVRLTGLTTAQVGALASEMGVTVPDAQVERLAVRSGGNPFFVCESVRLIARGEGLDGVPDAVADLIRQRLAGLGARTADVLRTAAVVGRNFDPALVAEVGAEDAAETYGRLDRAAEAGLLISGTGVMTFVHDLVRETLLGDLPPLRKAMIHRAVMTALAVRPGADVTTIAHHAVQAGPAAYRETAHWARAAADQAGLRHAYEEAASWWGHAVTAHGAGDGALDEHVELLLRQVRALLHAGDAMSARRVRAQAVRVANRSGAGPGLVARALTALDAPAMWALRNPYESVEGSLVEQFEATLRALPRREGAERALLLGGLAQELYGTGDERCVALSEQAIATARRIGDPRLLLRILNARTLSVPQADRVEELLGIAREIRSLAAATGSARFELLSHQMDTHYLLELGDIEGADRAARRCDVILDHLRLPWPRFQHTMWRANRLTLAGAYTDAETLYAEAERQGHRIGMWYGAAVAVNGRLMLRYQSGAMAEAGPLIDVITGIHPTVDHDARILQFVAQGRADDAAALAAQGWPTPPPDWSWLTMTCLQGAAQAAVGDKAACRVTREKLLPYSGRISGGSAVACIGPVDHFLDLLSAALGLVPDRVWS
ncbi:BTAD domain-containing putative transcriptional regulator [Herbidospora yilanensis]|uniref:BTAD domain-containing putative transcriptional regulator n=1 Tax=Herbidospora yilanensis TaxID=354426 RepID=UPI00078463E6|nr:BTAD domain-containing putative transcriptional regulator [Herbidospora yilanensis]